MRTIWKFPLSVTKVTAISVPADAPIRLAAIDPASGGPAIWIELDEEAPRIERRFWIYGTGHDIDVDSLVHVGSMVDRTFVWHVFEDKV